MSTIRGQAPDTATQTGWFAFDAGQPVAAQRYLLAALRAAHASGDARLGAGALSYIAIHSYSVGDPRDAVSASRAAQEKVRTLDAPLLNAMLLTRQARGHAKLGDEEGVRRALGRATEYVAQGRAQDDPHWLYWVTDGELHGQAGSSYLDLGNASLAAHHLTQAGASYNRQEARTRGLLLSRAAMAQVRDGQLEAGCATAYEAVQLAEQVDSARLTTHVRSLMAEVTPLRRASAVRDLLERAEDMTRGGTA